MRLSLCPIGLDLTVFDLRVEYSDLSDTQVTKTRRRPFDSSGVSVFL
jgi:hypothetical protein